MLKYFKVTVGVLVALLLVCTVVLVIDLSNGSEEALVADLQYSGAQIKQEVAAASKQGQDVVYVVEDREYSTWDEAIHEMGYPEKLARRTVFRVYSEDDRKVIRPVVNNIAGKSNSHTTTPTEGVNIPMLIIGVIIGAKLGTLCMKRGN